ncbi:MULTISPECIES: UvrD-helicase domain-containing protein [Agrobacterium]|uniref:DNA 3'-5' helicase II n=1 Tax=Agrobacterium tumefaciens TaxID=358 RepID=A0AAE6BGK7_AGRTU|nr:MULTISPECIES: UvrD-helicase domain-containing protein [Agrobacterium]QCL76867.1 ATP-dependent helicase [Agrobacterium tumefaciens]QCL82373.1 ATP-dependent helicase [Agrobacterium tumefaciens]
MTQNEATNDNLVDKHVDDEIFECLDLDAPKSFFMYAGAGSGKTRSLIEVLRRLREKAGERLALGGRNVGVITFTNAACDEIKQRLDFDVRVVVSTIHSFAWSLIQGYNDDIREWLKENLKAEIAELQDKQTRGRASKASADRERSILSKTARLAALDDLLTFQYSPTGDNRERDALNHSEVISITASFLTEKPGLRSILVNAFPILLIDESQDTNKDLLAALLTVQKEHGSKFSLGLFGDTMQRIYSDGMVGLERALPASWERPAKVMNHRSRERIIRLINRIRKDVDGQEQRARSNKPGGHVRLFIVPSGRDQTSSEGHVRTVMVKETGDDGWIAGSVKSLILEHHMAARRLGFSAFFEPLHKVERLRTGLLDGSYSAARFFAKDVLTLVKAIRSQDDFEIAAAVRERSPLLEKKALQAEGVDQAERILQVQRGVDSLAALFAAGASPTFLDVLGDIAVSQLFPIPAPLTPFVGAGEIQLSDDDGPEEPGTDEKLTELEAWRLVLGTPFAQIENYESYVSRTSSFDTHQGVKGLEFPRVLVIVSDEEARGFLFSYEKLFGAKAKSATDIQREAQGDETTIDRTRRLFYVTCSRAEDSLAIIAYSDNPSAVKSTAVENGWFEEQEVNILWS